MADMRDKNTANTTDILVLLQPLGEGIHPVGLAAVDSALELAAGGRRVCGLLLAERLHPQAEELLRASGLEKAYVYLHPALAAFRAEQHCAALMYCLHVLQPQSLLVGATPEGRTVAPMAAAHLHTGVTADCTALGYTAEGLLLQTRPAFGGDMMADIITPTARPQICTLRYGTPARKATGANTPIETIQGTTDGKAILDTQSSALSSKTNDGGNKVNQTASPIIHYPAEWLDSTTSEQQDYDVIIALGGGLAHKDDIAPFAAYARETSAGLMCSRALVERDWFGRESQIGLSGRSVSPRLLVTFGVSGSVQFMAGAGGAGSICAVNIDGNAPIMSLADIPILGDLYEIVSNLSN